MRKIGKRSVAAVSAALALAGAGTATAAASTRTTVATSAQITPACPPASQLASTGYSTGFGGYLYELDLTRLKATGSISGLNGPSNSYVSKDGKTVYIDNWGGGTVEVLNACTRQIDKSVNVNGPVLGAMSRDGRYLYEVGYQGLGATGRDTTVYVIDTSSNTVVRTWPVKDSFALTLSPDGRRVYVAGVDDVYVFDTAGNRLDTLSTGHLPEWLAVTPDGRTLLSSNYDGTTTATNIATGARLATIDHGAKSAPEYVTITPDGTQAWVTLGIGGVAVISLADYSSTVVPTSGMGLTVTFSNDGKLAYVSEGGPDTVNDDGVAATEKAVSGTWKTGPGNIRVFSVATHKVVTTIQTAPFPGNVSHQPS
ncbi:hypothetical protein F8568_010955 [Actinomadura sp. LD22]|uniref:YncE family protein n=1 Tax=Actinomadura physcomitrii TaxID=2650748 RepID=A0A6I4MAR1_9ACTN|nr:hypothetical protein [Actinomadura physcomitrii]MWA00891.1 hypothetical protein [Actinomadura physcomitrii]